VWCELCKPTCTLQIVALPSCVRVLRCFLLSVLSITHPARHICSISPSPPRSPALLPLPALSPSLRSSTQLCTYSAFKRLSVSGVCGINEGHGDVSPESCLSSGVDRYQMTFIPFFSTFYIQQQALTRGPRLDAFETLTMPLVDDVDDHPLRRSFLYLSLHSTHSWFET
jgi:hypothetical protein